MKEVLGQNDMPHLLYPSTEEEGYLRYTEGKLYEEEVKKERAKGKICQQIYQWKERLKKEPIGSGVLEKS